MTSDSGFQSFEVRGEGARGPERLALLRDELRRLGVDGFVVPRADEHQGEYVPPSAERLAWLTGFTGSAGSSVVLMDEAALFVDGRYALQARSEVDTGAITPVPIGETSQGAWIEAHLPAGAALAYDPWLHTKGDVERLERAVAKAGGRLAPLDANPVDAIRDDRPAPPRSTVEPHDPDFAGEASEAKIGRVREALAKERCGAQVISDPHNLCWLLNVRGRDVAHTPLVLAYAILPREGAISLFVEEARVPGELRAQWGDGVRLEPPGRLAAALAGLGGGRVRVDAATGAARLSALIEEGGGRADVGPDPITRLKAVKNAAEIAGTRAAHLRDGAAVARFLAWLAREAPGGRLTEIDAALTLEAFRRETGRLQDISFPTIAGAGPNGAIVHYRVNRETNRTIGAGELFLVDSGGQYRDGTTDITRTVAVREPVPEMRERFTRVLRGHIAMARAVFPKGTSGAQIDALARVALWEAGLDFDHGTGHGVGSFLSVHEGPQRIAKLGHAAIEAGMILSNEPGYYKPGAYGIRIENLVLAEARAVEGAEREMLGFETLTLAPIDRALVDGAGMRADEIGWLDAYHCRVREALGPLVDEETRAWLEGATAPFTPA